MRPTELLKNEHQVLLIALDALDHLEQALAYGGGSFPGEMVGRILDFMTVYADQFHYYKEEQLLIPRLELRGMTAADGPIGLVRQEHAMARHRVAQALKLLPAAAKGDARAQVDLRRFLVSTVNLLRAHIGMEELIFLRQADLHLLKSFLLILHDAPLRGPIVSFCEGCLVSPH